jgi:hypothetical protein
MAEARFIIKQVLINRVFTSKLVVALAILSINKGNL